MGHPDISQYFTDNRFPAETAGYCDPALWMTLLQDADAPATLPDHGLVPFRDLGRPDGEGLFQFPEVRTKGGLEEQGRVERVPFTAIKCNENILPDREPVELVLVMEHFSSSAADRKSVV